MARNFEKGYLVPILKIKRTTALKMALERKLEVSRQRQLSEAQLRQRREAAVKGGEAVLEKHGTQHFRLLGQRMHEKYMMVPCGTSNFAYVDRETYEIVAYQFQPRDRQEAERFRQQVNSALNNSW